MSDMQKRTFIFIYYERLNMIFVLSIFESPFYTGFTEVRILLIQIFGGALKVDTYFCIFQL